MICSVAGFVAMAGIALLSGNTSFAELIIFCICAVETALLGFPFVWSLALTVSCVSIVLLCPEHRITCLSLLLAAVMTVASFHRTRRRYSSVRPLFCNDAVWKGLQETTLVIATLLVADDVILLCVSVSLSNLVGEIIAAAASVALYFFAFLRYYRGRTAILDLATQDEILNLARGCLRPHEFDPDNEDKRMTVLYRRVLEYMDEKKPYLDEDISLEQLSRHVYSNKTYLSKTINVMSGHNYRQFMNYYRVEHAMSLLREDPDLKMEDVAWMSGFHNVVSFNMAFKLFRSETPTEWMRLNHIRE